MNTLAFAITYGIAAVSATCLIVRWFREQAPNQPTTLLDVVFSAVAGLFWPGAVLVGVMFWVFEHAHRIQVFPPLSKRKSE
jgi:hypothetical protein